MRQRGEQKGTSLPTVAREGTVLDRGADREGTNDIICHKRALFHSVAVLRLSG